MVWPRMDIPVIAAVHGVCFGAGLQLALGADIRIAAPDAQFAVMEMKWGIVPDMGGMVLLPRLVRSDVLRRLTYTAEPVGAAQAERWGLVTELADDPLAAALALAETIAGKSPSAIRAAKRLIAVAETQDASAVLEAESREQADLMGKPHQMEVVAAALGKRAAVFDCRVVSRRGRRLRRPAPVPYPISARRFRAAPKLVRFLLPRIEVFLRFLDDLRAGRRPRIWGCSGAP